MKNSALVLILTAVNAFADLTVNQVDFSSAWIDSAYFFAVVASLLVSIMGIKAVFKLMGH